ncbi:exonuclease domain-containing protein [Corynebacterium epidermidicanis]|uniref:DNA polymerase III epsilon subunit-like 3'-5' exonuclease n=1 Tax=Corynebacterium epidermidicanis TaxID=1050174 RepID=A0A0G3GQV9_9CORY|nr:exonuclease domain-containing protein [Corynebacterium epidermidicanis]AKK02960.1 DNA polymerase III epsilon subunit-like 3'-5' exonuclease [Corynebacterium epidermidicanis]
MFGFGKKKSARGALAEYLAQPAVDRDTAVEKLNLLAVDVETTGLKAGRDALLSIGWVPVTAGVIELAAARHHVLQTGAEVGQSATVHGLTDDQVAAGSDPREALGEFLDALQGRIALVHYAPIEQNFLSHACNQHFGAPLKLPVVDTFALERRHMERMGTYPRGEDLRLGRVRARYGLPTYRNHNALTDALATAELYLAWAARSTARTLRDLQV